MLFYVTPFQGKIPADAVFPCAQLEEDSWNDFGFVTLFHLSVFQTPSTSTTVGDVKILKSDDSISTKLSPSFNNLSPDFCSLGQSMDYYRRLSSLPKPQGKEIVVALNDIARSPSLSDGFQELSGFQSSLLRFSEAKEVWDRATKADAKRKQSPIPDETPAGDVAEQQPSPPRPLNINIDHVVGGFTTPHQFKLTFDDHDLLPDRMIALIGKNGTGKTQTLRYVSQEWSKSEQPAATSFTRVIGVSYSAFNAFPSESPELPRFRRCGLIKNDVDLRTAINQVVQRGRLSQWTQALRNVFDPNLISAFTQQYTKLSQTKNPEAETILLSSGEAILLAIISDLLGHIELHSMVLFDEPEVHLHPNAIGGLMKCLEFLLTEYKSYSLVATHSPLVIQQIPARYVRLYDRVGNAANVFDLGVESFGENLTVLTEEVFHADLTPSLYRDLLREWASQRPFEEVLSVFPNGLSFSARTFLRSLYPPAAPQVVAGQQ